MSARANMNDARRLSTLPEEPDVDPIDDALWHLQVEVRRIAQLAERHGFDPAQRRELERSLAVLHAAAGWQPARAREAEPAL